MNADDHSVERESHDDQSRDDADQLNHGETNGSDDDSDGEYEGSEESGVPACPFCGSRSGCNHKIAFWSGCNADWDGSLVDASKSVHRELVWILWRGYVLRGTRRQASDSFSWSLTQLVKKTSDIGQHDNVDDSNCDWWGPLRKYWMSVSEECGCVVLDHIFDDGACGTCDHFKHVVAEHPEASIDEILQQAEKDLLDLRAWFELTTDDVPPTRSGLA